MTVSAGGAVDAGQEWGPDDREGVSTACSFLGFLKASVFAPLPVIPLVGVARETWYLANSLVELLSCNRRG